MGQLWHSQWSWRTLGGEEKDGKDIEQQFGKSIHGISLRLNTSQNIPEDTYCRSIDYVAVFSYFQAPGSMGQKFGFSVAMGLVNPMSIHNCMRVQMSYMSKVNKRHF